MAIYTEREINELEKIARDLGALAFCMMCDDDRTERRDQTSSIENAYDLVVRTLGSMRRANHLSSCSVEELPKIA